MSSIRISYSAIGAAFGISKQAVGKLVLKGMPVDSIEAARAWRAENLDAARDNAARMSIDEPPAAPPAADLAAADLAAAEDPLDAGADAASPAVIDEHSEQYRRDRARNERIKADSAQLELDQLRGEIISLDAAKRLAFTSFRTLRDAVLNVPARIKDQCAAITDALLIEQLIEDELRTALESIDPDRVLTETEPDDDETD